MHRYTKKDIPPLDWDAHVRNNLEMYFDVSEVTVFHVALALKYPASILGARLFENVEIDGWNYFCSNEDWIFNSSVLIQSELEVFTEIQSFPEDAKLNSFRTESLCLPVVRDAFTYNVGSLVLLKGKLPSEADLKKHRAAVGNWGRVVGYRM
ncbi:hypothetical protein VST7929_02924 [Vibrio stylophorae]|uniref:Uncharacterized protein n=1 Tax=Vibrio stylophorae TaxID=659351 RepID=A0ABM8ZYD6_9VIBR|nr:hypothetical protein [Vibrio stylophorae]CAH0535318.1 hypothetical protein VST7929_02924 [Vibrio stylophorae]